MTTTLFRSVVMSVLLPLCACGVATPEEESLEVGSSESALIYVPPTPPKEDPCITKCKTIVDDHARNACITKCIIDNFR